MLAEPQQNSAILEELIEKLEKQRGGEVSQLLCLAMSSETPPCARKPAESFRLTGLSETLRNAHHGHLDFETLLADYLNPLIQKNEPVPPELIG